MNISPDLQRMYQRLITSGASDSQLSEWAAANSITPELLAQLAANNRTPTFGAQLPSVPGAQATNAAGFLSKFRGMFGNGKVLGPNIGNFGDLKGLVGDVQNTNLMGLGKVKHLSQAGMGIYQGANALKGLSENAGKDSDYNSLKNDINLSIASNPMYDMYLDAADEKRLRQMRNGSLNNGMNGALEGGMKGIPQALLAALIGGVAGGPGGAVINGVGSLVNSGIKGYGNAVDKATGELQGLYSKLRQADSEYKTMKRPTGLGRAGLSTHYFNQLY